MKVLVSLVASLLLCLGVTAQEHASHAQTNPVTFVTGLGNLHHPVSTTNSQAQQFFDQGLRFIYAFNHDEAARSFQRAAELDPKLAMAYRTTTIPPTPRAMRGRITLCRRQWIWRRRPHRVRKLTSWHWQSGSPRIPAPT